MTKRILCVSDIHSGSSLAVMPDEVWIEKKDALKSHYLQSNKTQKILYKAWCDMVDEAGQVDACFVLGDGIDGPNVKSRGFELWTSNLHQQVTTACDLLSMIHTNRYCGVQGSLYHVGENTSSDLAIIDILHGTFGTDLAVKDIGDCRFHLNHEIGYSSSPISKATAPQSELIGSLLSVKYFGEFDLLLRGHRHEYYNYNNAYGHIIGVPGWKVRDAYMAKKGLRGFGTQIGWVLLEIDGKEITERHHVFLPTKEHLIKEVSL